MFRKFVKISEISKYLDISGKCVSIKSGVEEKITVNFGNSQFMGHRTKRILRVGRKVHQTY